MPKQGAKAAEHSTKEKYVVVSRRTVGAGGIYGGWQLERYSRFKFQHQKMGC
jgi:hypothetical protein